MYFSNSICLVLIWNKEHMMSNLFLQPSRSLNRRLLLGGIDRTFSVGQWHLSIDGEVGWESIRGIWAVTGGGDVPLIVFLTPHWINTEISSLKNLILLSFLKDRGKYLQNTQQYRWVHLMWPGFMKLCSQTTATSLNSYVFDSSPEGNLTLPWQYDYNMSWPGVKGLPSMWNYYNISSYWFYINESFPLSFCLGTLVTTVCFLQNNNALFKIQDSILLSVYL